MLSYNENAGGGLGYEDSLEVGKQRREALEQAKIAKLEKEATDINEDQNVDAVQKSNKREQAIEEFQKKWAGAVLLGPFVPAIMSLIVIFSGQIVLNSTTGTGFLCQYRLDIFISVEITVCYLFLILYSWVFLGDNIYLKIPSLEIDWLILIPFTSLKSVLFWYITLAVISTIAAVVGTLLLALSNLCAVTTPIHYRYSVFLVVLYWLMFIVIISNIFSMYCGKFKAVLKPTTTEIEEALFLKKFRKFDTKTTGSISVEVSLRLCV